MNDNSTQQTHEVAKKWFDSLGKGDFNTAINCLAENIVWKNIPPVPKVSDLAPWLGSYNGVKEVLDSFDVWAKYSKMLSAELLNLVVEDENAIGIVHEHAVCLANNNEYDLYVATRLKVENNKITEWQVYWDPSPLIAAYKCIQE